MAIPQPSSRHSGRLLGKGLLLAISHYDRIWWKENRTAWNIVHQQSKQWLADIDAWLQKIPLLQVPELERLAQLLQRTGQPQRVDEVMARIRQLAPSNARALWHGAMQMAQKSDLNALPLLKQLVQQEPVYTASACGLALDMLERHPNAPERTVLRKYWREQQEHHEELCKELEAELQGADLFARVSADHGLSSYELQDFIASAQQLSGVRKIWLMRMHSRTMPWQVLHLAIVEPVARQQDKVSMHDIQRTLVTPGSLNCLHQDWLAQLEGSTDLPELATPTFDRSVHKLGAPV